MLKKEQIKSAKRKTEIVDVPEWGVDGDSSVLIGVMTAKDLTEYMKTADDDDPQGMIKFCAKIILDPETGERMFSDDELDVIGELSMTGVRKVFEAGVVLHGMDQVSIDNAVKN